MYHQKMYTYILLVDDHDEAGSYVSAINKQTNLNKPTSKLKLFEKQFHRKYLS